MEPSHRVDFRGDCAHCQGLCCVSLAFDRSESFSFDKPADVPCRHLQRNNRCRIHSDLAGHGHLGCARYDCYGAGQRLSPKVAALGAWRDDLQVAQPLFAAFRQLVRVRELQLLLHEAGTLRLRAEHEVRRQSLLLELEHGAELLVAGGSAMDVTTLDAVVREFLLTLRDYVTARRLPLAKSDGAEQTLSRGQQRAHSERPAPVAVMPAISAAIVKRCVSS